ncbi:MAG: hypothetical protein H7210_13485 [Pyrinomonadaceae bacterium]|nr:hypothetical protein [Phycisphaerales bacterium]
MQRSTHFNVIGAAALLSMSAGAHAQIFHRAIGFTTSEGAYSVETCSAATGGGFITAGRLTPGTTGLRNMYVVRYDPNGNDIWTRVISSPNGGDEVATSVRQTLDGGFIIAGETSAGPQGLDIAMIRLNPAGGLVWARLFAGTAFQDFPSGVKVREVPDGTFTVVGRTRPGFLMQGRMINVGPGGGPVWANTYSLIGPPAHVSFTDVRFVPANPAGPAGYFVTGWMQEETATQRSALLLRTDASGNPLGCWTYSMPNRSLTADGLTIVGGNIVFSGRISVSPTAAPTNTVIASVTQAAGNVNWARTEGDFRNGFAALATDVNTVILAGTIPSSGDIGVVKLNAAGATIFANSHDAQGEGHDVVTALGFANGYVVTGVESLAPVNGLQDVSLIRTDVLGDAGCLVSPIPGPVATTILRTPRSMTHTANLQNVTMPILITTPNSGNIIKCFEQSVGDPPACRADWNNDGVATSQDFFEFIQAFFAGDADFNADGDTNTQDFFDFLAEFFTGC